MIIYLLYLLIVIATAVNGQKPSQSGKGGTYTSPIPYYNLAGRPGSGVGVLQDLSNARILSNEPFIISFEFPKIGGAGKGGLTDSSRKSRFGNKRSKTGRKKHRRPRGFPKNVQASGDTHDRTKRFHVLFQLPAGNEKGTMGGGKQERGKNFLPAYRTPKLLDKSFFGRRLKPMEAVTMPQVPKQDSYTPSTTFSPIVPDVRTNILQQVSNNAVAEPQETQAKAVQDADNRRRWQEVKDSWAELLDKRRRMSENEIVEEKVDEKSRKMWANCQLFKLLKAPQRNPYFYRLLPPNYQGFILDEEKQLQCNQLYDITELARDKKRVEEKIDELVKIISPSFGESGQERRKRDVREGEEQSTLEDESLQGKAEGETRSDRSKRTKAVAEERVEKRRKRVRGRKTSKERKTKKSSETKKQTNAEETHPEAAKQEMSQAEKDGNRKSRQAEKNEVPRHKATEEGHVKEKDGAKPISQAELNRIVKQKELEANIFDKVLTAMKKYEESTPYDESPPPRKRENRNETNEENEESLPGGGQRKAKALDSLDEGFELEDAVKTLAQVFKMLSMRQDMKKTICAGCVGDTVDGSGEEVRAGSSTVKSTPRCSCPEDCPFCLNCLKCFNDCTRNAISSSDWKMTPIGSTPPPPHSGYNDGSRKDENEVGSVKDVSSHHTESTSSSSSPNAIKRMYRSKLPPSRDLVRLYFDNPENKLLVWTKRGRRTMPWGPLESDLQLYRDRARQILKSAEDILQRIRETEEKIHPNDQDGQDHAQFGDRKKDEKVMDDIIKKVVSEDETAKKLLKTQWEDQIREGYVEKAGVKDVELSRIVTPEEDQTEQAKQEDDLGVKESKDTKQEPKYEEIEEKEIADTIEAIRQRLDEEEMESKSVEAAVVEDIKEINKYVKDVDGGDEKLQQVHESEEAERKEVEKAVNREGEEDVQARVESLNSGAQDAGPSVVRALIEEKDDEDVARSLGEATQEKESKVAVSESVEEDKATALLDKDGSTEVLKSDKTQSGESKEASEKSDCGSSSEEELSPAEILRQLKKAIQEEEEEEEAETDTEDKSGEESSSLDKKKDDENKSDVEMNRSLSDEEEVHSGDKSEAVEEEEDGRKSEVKATQSEEISEEDHRSEEGKRSLEVVETTEASAETTDAPGSEEVGKVHGEEKMVFDNQIKAIEDNYIIKGVKQSKEEKEAILKVLQGVKGSAEDSSSETAPESESHLREDSASKERTAEEEVEAKSPDGDSFKTLMNHLERGHMDEKDLEAVKKLDGANIDLLVDEMQKNDEKGVTTSCKTRLKLCQAVCACNGNETTAQELNKYDIVRGFLSWLKEVHFDEMVPISV